MNGVKNTGIVGIGGDELADRAALKLTKFLCSSQDPLKCSCVRLTMEEKERVAQNQSSFGYQYRRLPERSTSVIYECNSR